MKKMGDGSEGPQSGGQNPPDGQYKSAMDTYGQPQKAEGQPLPDPEEEDVKKYDLDITDYSKDQDEEEVDQMELDE
jgi:hypothetical protein